MTESAPETAPPPPPAPSSAKLSWNWHLSLFFVLLILLWCALFEVMRAGMILRNSAETQSLGWGQILSSFVYGLRFDLAIACYVVLPVVAIGHIPWIGIAYSPKLRRVLYWLMVITAVALIFVQLAEFEFFKEFQTRYNQLAFQYLDQPRTVVGMMWYNYPIVRYLLTCAVLTTLFALGLRFLDRKFFGPGVRNPVGAKAGHEAAQMALLIGLMVIGMRGGLQEEPLHWGNAYHSSNEFINQMSLNGVYALGQSAVDHFQHRKSSAWTRKLPYEQARAVTRSLIVAPNEKLLEPEGSTVLREPVRPAKRTVTLKHGERPPNVVLVLMESFSARFVGACGSKPDFTPHINQLAADGIVFDHAFSGGTHTHQGVFCSMLGFPNLPGFEYLMQNIVSNQPFLGLPTVLKREGYQTFFIYNGNMSWDNMEGFFRKQGVDKFIGSPDYVNPIHRDRVWGVTDQDVFDRANQEFEAANAKGPFFSLILTLSNHIPFDLPEPLPFPKTTDMGEQNKRMDGVKYADWAVGRFIEQAKKLKYFENTLFVFVGDHGFHVDPTLTEVHLLYHHVPMVFYSPLLSEKGLKISSVAAQMNILPTVMGLLGIAKPQAAWGRDLFSQEFSDENFVVFKGSGGSGSSQAVALLRGDKMLVVGSEGTTKLWQYALNPTAAVTPLDDPAAKDRMLLEVNAYVQSAMNDLMGTQKIDKPTGELLHDATTTSQPTTR